MRGGGSQRRTSRSIRAQVMRAVWLRRRNARHQSRPTWERKVDNAGPFMGTP